MRTTLLIISLFTLFSAHASDNASATHFKEWVPHGWKLIKSAKGDLNQDGKIDAVLVLERTDPKNLKQSDGLGVPVLNLNPRRLVVLLKTTAGYNKVVETARFLPSENSADSTCLSDPLEEGGIGVVRGLLQIDLHSVVSGNLAE